MRTKPGKLKQKSGKPKHRAVSLLRRIVLLGGVFHMLHHRGDKAGGKFSLAPVFDIEKANEREQNCTDEIDKQILHGIDDTDIQIAAQPQGLLGAVSGDHDHINNVFDGYRVVSAGGVQHHGTDGVNHRIFLHIQKKEIIHGKLEKFPQHTDGHGKAEGHHRQVDR